MSALSKEIAELRRNDRQWEALRTEGHCAVLAPPGSGKTKLLTTKLAHCLSSGLIASPRGAACITMTNEAALQLRQRLRQLGVPRAPNLFVGTVHSFALSQIIGPFAAAAGRDDLARSRPATPEEEHVAFEAAFQAMGFRPHERGEIKATTERARQRLDLSGNRFLGGEPVAKMARRLQDELEARHVFDPQDLVRHAVELVEGAAWVGKVLSDTFSYVFVDEYQDLAPGLDRIVRGTTLRADTDSTLFAVGDPDQSIYAFTGASPELLDGLAAEPDVTEIRLERNYRCGQRIIDISLRALGEDREIEGNHEGGDVFVHEVSGGVAAQAAKGRELVQAALKAGKKHEEIAVIAPWNADHEACTALLQEEGIPVYSRSDKYWKPTTLTMLLEAMASWCDRRDDSGIDLSATLDGFAGVVPAAWEHVVLRRCVQVLLDLDGTAPAHELLERIRAAALRRLLARSTGEDARELRRMLQALGPTGKLKDMTVAELGARARAPGHVMAASIHGAKGLEFDVVIMLGADHACLPGFDPNPEEFAEAKRKFYVTLTRAREVVHLVHTDGRISGRTGRPYSVEPTPFIAELAL